VCGEGRGHRGLQVGGVGGLPVPEEAASRR
jgi:hypothetical protein